MEYQLTHLMEIIEETEKEAARLRNIYYHVQHWINTGVIKDARTCETVITICRNYPDRSFYECYDMALTFMGLQDAAAQIRKKGT